MSESIQNPEGVAEQETGCTFQDDSAAHSLPMRPVAGVALRLPPACILASPSGLLFLLQPDRTKNSLLKPSVLSIVLLKIRLKKSIIEKNPPIGVILSD